VRLRRAATVVAIGAVAGAGAALEACSSDSGSVNEPDAGQVTTGGDAYGAPNLYDVVPDVAKDVGTDHPMPVIGADAAYGAPPMFDGAPPDVMNDVTPEDVVTDHTIITGGDAYGAPPMFDGSPPDVTNDVTSDTETPDVLTGGDAYGAPPTSDGGENGDP
jgi:hypothetical protein